MIGSLLFDNPALPHINHFWTFSIALKVWNSDIMSEAEKHYILFVF